MKSLLIAILVLVGWTPLQAGYSQGDPRLEKLYSTFLAPCCWRDNLDEHDSPTAAQLRARIQGLVRDGESDAQIKKVLVEEFTPRILTLPEGSARTWLFWTPWFAGALGLLAVIAKIRAMMQGEVTT
jgi:cytochrome c-type biogenesis protein CcmH